MNVNENNRDTTRKIMFWLRLQKNLQVGKLYVIFGAILRLLKASTVPLYWAKLNGTGYKE